MSKYDICSCDQAQHWKNRAKELAKMLLTPDLNLIKNLNSINPGFGTIYLAKEILTEIESEEKQNG